MVTTLSAKADSFLGHARSNLPRFVPNAQSERQNITGGVDITVNHKPAMRASVNTVSKRFRNIGGASATGAYLRCPVGVDRDELPPSFFHFVGQFVKERTPSGIVYRLGKHPPRQCQNVQVLNSDKPVTIGDFATELVLKVRALIVNVSVGFLKQSDGFPSVSPASFASGNFPLNPSEFGLACLEGTGVVNQFAVRERNEGIQSHVNTDCRGLLVRYSIGNQDTESGIPLASFPLQSDRPNIASNRAMQLQLDYANALNLQPIVDNVATVSPNGECEAVKPITGLKPRITRLLPRFHPAKEGFVCLINTAKHILTSRIVGKVKAACMSYLFELIGLVIVVKASLLHLPSISTLLEGSIIQMTSLRKLIVKGYHLLFAWVKAIFVGSSQQLKPSFANFATRYNNKVGIGRLHNYYTTRKEIGQFLCQLKAGSPLALTY